MNTAADLPPASTPPRRRLLRTAAIALLILAVLAGIGFYVAARQLKDQVQAALGPRSEVDEVRLGWSGVELLDLRVRGESRGPRRWPAEDELRARRVRVVPELLSLLRAEVRIRRITVEGGYVSMLRSADGRLRVLPALTAATPRGGPAPKRGGAVRKVSLPASAAQDAPAPAEADRPLPVHIGEVVLDDAVLELFDASVRRPPLKLRLEQLDAQVGPLDLPALDTPTQVDLQGLLKGRQRDGSIKLVGELTLATRDARLHADFKGVDLVALQPYLIRVADAGVQRGTLDLRLDATVRRQQLRAPGHLTLTGLELSSSGLLGSLAAVPREAVLAALRKNERIELDFTLAGRLDDPDFSLNEDLATQVASGLAEALGVSLGGMVEGMGDMLKGLMGQ
ncbi:DUF748 domain-containing protein [Aquabacterium sp. A7-Y]|uniref:DUF748 domain-containing protein n=1 Tax=Aquabacterium sp. A7-Y TaxID=1349605 RepID=UPI00223DC97E|nr:DUF748 domain-containing protein [Aquabacterium sp. A7-Y]MCW7541526.1 DUF748 domain-containing protein [Aquabacterium sp. A7-Y]